MNLKTLAAAPCRRSRQKRPRRTEAHGDAPLPSDLKIEIIVPESSCRTAGDYISLSSLADAEVPLQTECMARPTGDGDGPASENRFRLVGPRSGRGLGLVLPDTGGE